MRSTVFNRNSPSIDLHGETTDTIELLINDFIKDNIVLGNVFVSIVHGKGSGALRHKTHEVLKKNPSILEYKINMWNTGETIVKLKIN